jgi:hypothetical protein
VVAAVPAATNMAPAATAIVMAEMISTVAVPVTIGIGIPKDSIPAPVTVNKRSIIAVIIAVIISGTGYGDADASTAVVTSATGQDKRDQKGGGDDFFQHMHLQFLR